MTNSVRVFQKSIQFRTLISFLKKNNIAFMAISVYIGVVLQKFLNSFVNDIFVPLVTAPLPDSIREIDLNIWNLNINRFMIEIINVLIAVFISYLFIKLVIQSKD